MFEYDLANQAYLINKLRSRSQKALKPKNFEKNACQNM